MSCDQETAEREFARFGELMDLDFDESLMDEDDLKGFHKHKRILIEAIKTGHVTVNEEGELTLNLKKPTDKITSCTFREPSGATLLAMDQKKQTQEVSKMFSMLQEMAGLEPGTLAKVKQRDMKVVQAIGLLFLA